MKNTKTKILLGVVVLLVFANFFIWEEIFGLSNGNLEVTFFDVGQGDSIFIETPEGHQILVDGGPSGGVILEKLSNEMPFWDRTIDLVVLTHPDYDHLRGLLDVLERYNVEKVLWTGAQKETATYQKWLELLKKEKVEIFITKKGDTIKAGGAIFYVLHPFDSLEGVLPKNSNTGSIVMQMVFGKNTFLFTGDITKEVEGELLVISSFAAPLKSDVLKIAHHGSKNSSASGFIELVAPQAAVISCGKGNNYGHPHQEVLSVLGKFGINILRTDEQGDVKIFATGKNFIINY